MSLFGSLFKTKKVNQATPQPFRTYSDAPLNEPLSLLAKKRINAGLTGNIPDDGSIGFGPDFVSKTTNPAIAQRNAQFTQQEMPFISSQLSARGVGRSGGAGLATDIVNKASEQKNRDVDEIFAKMFQLNKAQEKADISEGIGLGKNLDDSYIAQENQKSSAAERQVSATNADARAREARDAQLSGNILQAGAQLAVPMLGGMSGMFGGLGGMLGGGAGAGYAANAGAMGALGSGTGIGSAAASGFGPALGGGGMGGLFSNLGGAFGSMQTGAQQFNNNNTARLNALNSNQLGGMTVEQLLKLIGG